MLIIRKTSVQTSEAILLIQELSEELKKITGSSGRGSFQIEEMENPRSAFFISYLDGEAVGCGAIREYTHDIGEIKRVYSRIHGQGVGKAIVSALEQEARSLGYTSVVLETRKVNETAVQFYLKNGYTITENYGKYMEKDKSICFAKNV